MGTYLSAEKLEQHLGDRYAGLTGNDDALIESVIARAEAVIEGFASASYEIPLTPTALLEDWAICLCVHELYKRCPGSIVPEKIRDEYKRTISQLSDLAARKLGTGGTLVLKAKMPEMSPVSVQVPAGREETRLA